MQNDPLIDDLQQLTPAAPPPDVALRIAFAAGRESATKAVRWRATAAALAVLLIVTLIWTPPKEPAGTTLVSSAILPATATDDTRVAPSASVSPPAAITRFDMTDGSLPPESLALLTQAVAAGGLDALDALPRRSSGGRMPPETVYRLGKFR